MPYSRVLGVLLAAGALVGPTASASAAGDRAVAVRCHDNQRLIDAINQANTSGSGIVRLARRCTYTLTAVFPGDYGNNALPTITGRITIEGNGSTLARARNAPLMRIVQVSGSGALTILDATLANGRLDPTFSFGGNAFVGNPDASLILIHCRITGGFARWGGGALNDGPLTIVDSTVTGNSAEREGGGLWNRTTLSLLHSRVTRNRAILGIGGIATGGSTPGPTATTTVRSSMVSDNEGSGLGTDANMTLHVVDSMVTRNTASTTFPGGGIYNEGTTVVTNTLVSHNRSPVSSGGIHNAAGETRLERTTVSDNTAADNAGGLWALTGTVRLVHSKVTRNRARGGRGGGISIGSLDNPDQAGKVALDHTVVTRNVAALCGGGVYQSNGVLTQNESLVVGNRPDNVATRCPSTRPPRATTPSGGGTTLIH